MQNAMRSSSWAGVEEPSNKPFSARCFGASQLVRVWHYLSDQQARGIVLVFVVSLLAAMSQSLGRPYPEPWTHDEFGYLLLADPFAHGRLTNEPSPVWQHFESIHIIQQPSYTAKYPPAQGLILALGQVVGGHPIIGVWFSFALACAAQCWMLQAWVPRRWAALGAVFGALSLATTYWTQTYWGGSVAALGGALVFGAVRRIWRGARWRHGLLLGGGLGILANSRPFEGLVASLPVVILLALWLWRRRPPWRTILAALGPAVIVLMFTAAWMAWYNYRVTGSPLCTPYQAHDAAYAAAPTFLSQAPLEHIPTYRHQSMYDYYVGFELPRFLRKRVAFGLNSSACTKLWIFLKFFIGPLFLVPLVVILIRGRDRWMAFAAVTCGLVFLALTQALYLHPHYAAPIAGLVLVMVVQGIRILWRWQWRGRAAGRLVIAGIGAIYVVLAALPLAEVAWSGPPGPSPRTSITAQLEAIPGRHLVVVRYGPNHDCHAEWIYNAADIESARVIWAREMDADENSRLLEHFDDRQAWLLEIDRDPTPLKPYPVSPTR